MDRKKVKKREERLDVKFNTYRGALIFHSFLQTGKEVEEFLDFSLIRQLRGKESFGNACWVTRAKSVY